MRGARDLWLALIALLGATLALTPAAAQDFPKLSGRVVDQADLLPPAAEAALTDKLAAFEARSKQQLVVATVTSLNGRDIADYGVALARAWGVGSSARNDGVLFLIAPAERRMRIDVGYGLEPVLTDALSGRIIRDVVTPRFKAGDFAGGINAGTDAIIKQIELPPEQARANAAAADSKKGSSGAGLFFLIFWILLIFLVVLSIARGRRRGKKYRKRRSAWDAPVIIWGSGGDWNHSRGSRGSSWGGGGFSGGGGFGGFSGGGGGFGGGGASGGW